MPDFITIYTDASICPESKIGAWACWIKYENAKVLTASAPFNSLVENSTLAEMMAISNAVRYAMDRITPKEGTIFVVVTDSQGVIDTMAGKAHTGPGKFHCTMRDIAAATKRAVPLHCQLYVKKVKAHHNGDGKRSFVNRIVDVAARAAMRRARDNAKKAGVTNGN